MNDDVQPAKNVPPYVEVGRLLSVGMDQAATNFAVNMAKIRSALAVGAGDVDRLAAVMRDLPASKVHVAGRIGPELARILRRPRPC